MYVIPVLDADAYMTITAATIRVYMEKYEPPAAAEGEGDTGEGAEDGEDANAKLYIDTSEALKDIVSAALQVSGLQVRPFIIYTFGDAIRGCTEFRCRSTCNMLRLVHRSCSASINRR